MLFAFFLCFYSYLEFRLVDGVDIVRLCPW